MLVKDCFDLYERQHLNPSTVAPGRALRAWGYLQPFFGHLYPDEIKENHIKDYQRQRDWAGVAPTTVNRELGVLRSALNWCAKREHISAVSYIPNFSEVRRRERVLDKDEIARFLTASQRFPYVYKFYMLALFTAQRRGAILDLTWDRVDFRRRSIDFRDPDMYLAARRKGRAHVPMHEKLHALLTLMHEQRHCDHVIEHKGMRLPAGTLQYGWQEVRKDAGLSDDVTPHVIRHTVATDQCANGVEIAFIAQLLGHKSIRTTEQIYIKRNPDHLAGAISTMDY